MSELPKFLITNETPSDSPFLEAAAAWDVYEPEYARNRIGILEVISDTVGRLMAEPQNPQQSYRDRMQLAGAHIEERVSAEYPGFSIALQDLKIALDGIVRARKPATWNTYTKGDSMFLHFIDSPLDGQDTAIVNLRSPRAIFPEEKGYIVGHQIGFRTEASEAMGGLGEYPLWIETSSRLNGRSGTLYPLADMYAIREGWYED